MRPPSRWLRYIITFVASHYSREEHLEEKSIEMVAVDCMEARIAWGMAEGTRRQRHHLQVLPYGHETIDQHHGLLMSIL